MTQRESIVLEVAVEYDGKTHTSSYFVEHGIVHASVGGCLLLAPVLAGDAAEIVKRWLLHLAATQRQTSTVSIAQMATWKNLGAAFEAEIPKHSVRHP